MRVHCNCGSTIVRAMIQVANQLTQQETDPAAKRAMALQVARLQSLPGFRSRECPGVELPTPHWPALTKTLEKMVWAEITDTFSHQDERNAAEPFLQALRERGVVERIAEGMSGAASRFWEAAVSLGRGD
jgi:hypothetical protein